MKYESPITYHSKDMANVKVFVYRQTDKKKTTDKQTYRLNNICPPSFDTGA
jgi:hypothetical protein